MLLSAWTSMARTAVAAGALLALAACAPNTVRTPLNSRRDAKAVP